MIATFVSTASALLFLITYISFYRARCEYERYNERELVLSGRTIPFYSDGYKMHVETMRTFLPFAIISGYILASMIIVKIF